MKPPICSVLKNFRLHRWPALYLAMLVFIFLTLLPSGSLDKNSKVSFHHDSSASVKIVKKTTFDDADIVGYGEDCSSEGPFCDANQYLICDPVEEICTCDVDAGYVHIDDVPGHQQLFQYDSESFEALSNVICISTKDVEKKMEELLGLREQNTVNIKNEQQDALDIAVDIDDQKLKNEIYHDSEKTVEHFEQLKHGLNVEDIYAKVLKNFEDSGQVIVEEYDEERLKRFKMERIPLILFSEKELIVEEILKFGKKVADVQWEKIISIFLNINYFWNEHKLAKAICKLAFDVDRDGVFTYQEYVISILSKPIRELILPKVFLDLIGPLIENRCISVEDIQALEHYPETLLVDFGALDINGDGCFSFDEFKITMEEICRVNWFFNMVKEAGLEDDWKDIDPTPEEMYIRRLLQNERLSINWRIMDVDGDSYVSFDELSNDLLAVGYGFEDTVEEVEFLMRHLDKDQDGKVSLEEVKIQMSLPDFNEEYQFEWLESLYELYETDEPEIKEFVRIMMNNYTEDIYDLENSRKRKTNRIFEMFDRNRNGEMDEVELRLLMEIQKKYVVYQMLELTVASMDLDSDGKLSLFEYQDFFKNASTGFRIYFKNLLAGDDSESEESEEDSEEESDNTSSTELSSKAAAANDTSIVYRLFLRLDKNLDGFISKEDFHYHLSSFRGKKTDAELQQEFSDLDIDNDGLITNKDSEDVTEPLSFENFKDAIEVYSEEIKYSDLIKLFFLLDTNSDSIISSEEFIANKGELLHENDEKEFITWAEDYFGQIHAQTDADGEKAFKEFDSNCDGSISQTEFKSKLDELYLKSSVIFNKPKIVEEAQVYFKSLDLNKDTLLSYNEFQFLLLRSVRTDVK